MLSLILVITNSKHRCPNSLHSRVSPPICSSLWLYCSYNFRRCLSPYLIPSPCAPTGEQESDLAWKELCRGEWLFLTTSRAQGDREPHWGWCLGRCSKSRPGEPTRELVLTAPQLLLHSGAHSLFYLPKGEVTPPSSLMQTRSWREIAESPCCHHELRKLETAQVVSSLLWKVFTCDPELRELFPGWVKLQRNQDPWRGWIGILLELPRETGRLPHPGVCPCGFLPAPSLRGAMTKALTSPRSPHPQQVTQDRGLESARRSTAGMGVPKPRQARRGGPPASQEHLRPLGPSLLPLPDAYRSCFLQLFPAISPAAYARVRGPCTEPHLAFLSAPTLRRWWGSHLAPPSSTWLIPSPAHPRVCGQKQESSHMVVLLNGEWS